VRRKEKIKVLFKYLDDHPIEGLPDVGLKSLIKLQTKKMWGLVLTCWFMVVGEFGFLAWGFYVDDTFLKWEAGIFLAIASYWVIRNVQKDNAREKLLDAYLMLTTREADPTVIVLCLHRVSLMVPAKVII